MTTIYLMYLLGCFASIILYNKKRVGARVGFGISALASGYGAMYFISHLSQTESFSLSKIFLYNLHFELDPVGGFFSFVVTLISLAASIYAIEYSSEYEKKGNVAVMAMLFNLFILSMLLVLSVANVFWFMVFWELMTVVSAFLICFNYSVNSLKATIIYLGIAQIGAFALMGAFLILVFQTGSMEFSSFKNLSLSPALASVVFLLAFVGFGSKAGMFPFHVWLPKAHPAAPTNVSALMSGVMIKVALFGIVKFCLWLPVQEWWGLLILVVGALSSLLGVLYALIQHDYKALLAYHSVENIGIILLGFGTGVYGLGIHSPLLASIGFLAGFYHTVNHAIFKGLLFLCAGSVLFRTGTRQIEELGGLAKKMPYTAIGMFVGVMGIAALPPLNGFVSEWFTYQGMMQGAMSDEMLPRFLFSLAVIALALTGVLVVIHLKLYAVIFAGTPRKPQIWEKAKEAPISMVIGIFILITGCVAFGVCSPWVTNHIMEVVGSFSQNYSAVPNGGVISSAIGSSISLPLVAIMLCGAMSLPFILVLLVKANKTAPRETDPWACGFKYSSRMQMIAGPFTGDLKKLLDWLFRGNVEVKSQGYFKPVIYNNHPRDIWWDWFYVPFMDAVGKSAKKIQAMQNGSTNLYSLYILLNLCLFLAVSYIISGGGL